MTEIVYLPALASHATSTHTETVVWFVAAALWRCRVWRNRKALFRKKFI